MIKAVNNEENSRSGEFSIAGGGSCSKSLSLHKSTTVDGYLSSPGITPPVGGLKVRLIPDLSAAAFRNKKTNELCLWLCLRSLNWWGSGLLNTEVAIQGLQDIFNYSSQQLARQLKQGNGQFWQVTGQNGRAVIQIYALKTVCLYLGITLDGDKHYRDIKVADFGGLRSRRSQLYASIHNPKEIRGSKPFSRESITEYTGLSRIQQRRYEQEAGVKRTPNYAMQKDNEGKVIPVKQEIYSNKGGHYQVNKRLGNTYHTKQQASPGGMLRRTGAELRGKRSLVLGKAQKPLVKRFYKSMRALIKQILAPKGTNEGYYTLPSGNRLIPKRMEWCLLCNI